MYIIFHTCNKSLITNSVLSECQVQKTKPRVSGIGNEAQPRCLGGLACRLEGQNRLKEYIFK